MTQKSLEKNQPERFFAAAHPQKKWSKLTSMWPFFAAAHPQKKYSKLRHMKKIERFTQAKKVFFSRSAIIQIFKVALNFEHSILTGRCAAVDSHAVAPCIRSPSAEQNDRSWPT
jgi:hypothetical protein